VEHISKEAKGMSKRIWASLAVLLIAGGFSILAGQDGGNSRVKSLGNTYSISTKWYGFVTDTTSLRAIKGDRFSADVIKETRNVTADAVRKNVAAGAKYALINTMFIQRYMALEPAEKVAQFAGQQVWVTGTINTRALLKGGEGGIYTINVSSIAAHPVDSDWIY
jgi:hypothetical protein